MKIYNKPYWRNTSSTVEMYISAELDEFSSPGRFGIARAVYNMVMVTHLGGQVALMVDLHTRPI